ncbi:hypothetical protein [Cellvibrio fontiphilus]|uniref:IPTL-CTERM protein sorting domain-containing protein n=1 Tax=Cellvibrio fontiphilus TaxID=1815559 RepID=A0ABV7FDB6_9GAMM
MTHQHYFLAFFIALRRFGVFAVFSFIALSSTSVYAVYADCSHGTQQDSKVDCFSMPQLELLTANGASFAAEVATTSGIAEAETSAKPASPYPGFYVIQPHQAGGYDTESLPLMLLLAVLLAVLLVRARKLNNK